jgi:hypothetical protein
MKALFNSHQAERIKKSRWHLHSKQNILYHQRQNFLKEKKIIYAQRL